MILLNPEQPVAGIAQTRNDVALRIQLLVDRGREDWQLRRMLVDTGDAFRRRHQADQTDALPATFLQQLQRGHSAAPGGQHGIDEDDFKRAEIRWQAFMKHARLQRFLAALQSHEADARVGDEFEDGRNGSMVVKLAKANAPSC